MSDAYDAYVETAKSVAERRGLVWEIPCDALGKVARADAWDLTMLAGMAPPPRISVSDLNYDALGLAGANEIRERRGLPTIPQGPMPREWRDLFLAAVVTEMLVNRNKPAYALQNIGRQVRLLAACAVPTPPWAIDGDHVQMAYNVALHAGTSGKLALNLQSAVRKVLDLNHLCVVGPLASSCRPYDTETAIEAQRRATELKAAQNTFGLTERVRSELGERKGASKLPSERALWELVRIAFTERPRTFADALRFVEARLAILTGFRVGEVVSLPHDWARWRDYADRSGTPSGERGGISRSLMIRYFAEKQSADEGGDGVVLYESTQHVPTLFEQAVLDALSQAERLTRPLRERLRRQTKTGRPMPELSPDALITAADAFTRLTGRLQVTDEPLPAALVADYLAGFDVSALDALRAAAVADLGRFPLARSARLYFRRLFRQTPLSPRRPDGTAFARVHDADWASMHFLVRDLEKVIRVHIPTKLSRTDALTLEGGSPVFTHDLMFLMPIRALAEARDGGGILDVGRYFAVGKSLKQDMQLHLGLDPDDNLFVRYGETEADRALKVEMHSLRHLQNAELFRLGVSDAIITKRFGRRSVQQSYAYDHRSLAEDLAAIEVPPAAAASMGPRAREALKLIQGRKVTGPIVDEFRRIQRTQGDEAAFAYLDAEADGLHATPYGFCLSSLSVDPCPKHLECFGGCRHLTRTPLAEEQRSLETLERRLVAIFERVDALEDRFPGKQNLLKHARQQLEAVRRALAAAPGTQPFPDGPDLHRPVGEAADDAVIDLAGRKKRDGR